MKQVDCFLRDSCLRRGEMGFELFRKILGGELGGNLVEGGGWEALLDKSMGSKCAMRRG